MKTGVSVIICCHNSAGRLPATLGHLLEQRVPSGVSWEVVVVDNASTDDTAGVAESLWGKGAPAPLRVVHETRPGLTFARQRGFDAAQFEYVSFVDDDNWVSPDWIQRAAETMTAHPDVGACGGCSEAVCEVSPPDWFDRFCHTYAIGPQGERAGDVSDHRESLWGAGITIRKAAWLGLLGAGYSSLLTGRQGQALTSGEDAELCLALRLAGWRLWYEPRLRLRHFMPAERLTWSYHRRKERGAGTSSVGLDPYRFARKPERSGLTLFLRHVRQSWIWQCISSVGVLLRRFFVSPRFLLRAHEGNQSILDIEYHLGRLEGLWTQRRVYSRNLRCVRRAKWAASARSRPALQRPGSNPVDEQRASGPVLQRSCS